MTNSPRADPELRSWLEWGAVYGPSFIRPLAEAVATADLQTYEILRPALLELKTRYPREGSIT